MKKITGLFSAILFLISCNPNGSYHNAENAQDAGRQFIRASLDGDYDKARFYLLKDSVNQMMIDQQQINYNQMSGDEKRAFRESDIRPIKIEPQADVDTTYYTYYHTANTKDTTTIRIVKKKDEQQKPYWLVDLKSILRLK